jgi:hypothetical protein
MTADLLSRLRQRAHLPEYRICDEAADEIQNLRALVEQLRQLASSREARESVAHEILSDEEGQR